MKASFTPMLQLAVRFRMCNISVNGYFGPLDTLHVNEFWRRALAVREGGLRLNAPHFFLRNHFSYTTLSKTFSDTFDR